MGLRCKVIQPKSISCPRSSPRRCVSRQPLLGGQRPQSRWRYWASGWHSHVVSSISIRKSSASVQTGGTVRPALRPRLSHLVVVIYRATYDVKYWPESSGL
jgi:hypothetical protein